MACQTHFHLSMTKTVRSPSFAICAPQNVSPFHCLRIHIACLQFLASSLFAACEPEWHVSSRSLPHVLCPAPRSLMSSMVIVTCRARDYVLFLTASFTKASSVLTRTFVFQRSHADSGLPCSALQLLRRARHTQAHATRILHQKHFSRLNCAQNLPSSQSQDQSAHCTVA